METEQEREIAATTALIPVDASSDEWRQVLCRWLLTLQSDQTRATYERHIRACFTTSEKRRAKYAPLPDLADLTAELLEQFSAALRYRAEAQAPANERMASTTVNLRITALRQFLAYCRRRKLLAPDLTRDELNDALVNLHAHVQRPYQVVEGDEQTRLLDAAATSAYEPQRAVALIALGLGAGLRIAELCHLNVGDIVRDGAGVYVDVRSGKGNKDRQVPISEQVYALVGEYLTATGRAFHHTSDRATPLFLASYHGKKHGGEATPLTTQQARRVIISCAKRAGLLTQKRITPHGLRHSYAIDLLRGDAETGRAAAPVVAVATLLGHSDMKVTMGYVDHLKRGELAQYAPVLRKAE